MRRTELIRHLQQHGVTLIREGRRHTIVGKDLLKSQIPRHREIVDVGVDEYDGIGWNINDWAGVLLVTFAQ